MSNHICWHGPSKCERLDRDRKASHDLNRLLDKPGPQQVHSQGGRGGGVGALGLDLCLKTSSVGKNILGKAHSGKFWAGKSLVFVRLKKLKGDGFGVTHLLSSNVVPVLYIKCEMIDSTGKVIWNASDRMLPSIASPMDAIAWSQLTNDPKEIEAQLRKASKFLAVKLIKEL